MGIITRPRVPLYTRTCCKKTSKKTKKLHPDLLKLLHYAARFIQNKIMQNCTHLLLLFRLMGLTSCSPSPLLVFCSSPPGLPLLSWSSDSVKRHC